MHAYYVSAPISEAAAVTEKHLIAGLSLEAWGGLEDGRYRELSRVRKQKQASFWRVSVYPWKHPQRDPHPRCPRGKMRNKMFWGWKTWEDEGQREPRDGFVTGATCL